MAFDTIPCKGCKETREGYGLNPKGYHFDCQPCEGCGDAVSGRGLIKGKRHYYCGGKELETDRINAVEIVE